jgi:hypothetical protein
MTDASSSDWSKGGLRYSKLKAIVPEYLAPEPVEAFIVAVAGRRRLPRLLNPFSPFQREYVIASTPGKVVVLRLKRPGVFRAAIDKISYETQRESAAIRWDAGKVVLAGTDYWPISFHGEDAKELVALARG